MKISSKGRYALRVMVEFAEHRDEILSIKDISVRQGISEKYLEQIVSILVKANVLTSFRGANGGYKLSREPNKITISEIIMPCEGEISFVSCQDENATCEKLGECKVKNTWLKLNSLINDFLKSVTLQDILDKKV